MSANAFAAELLMPEATVKEWDKEGCDDLQMAQRFGVSTEAMNARFTRRSPLLEGVKKRLQSVLQGTPSWRTLDWRTLETATRDIVDAIKDRDDAPATGLSAVIAGTVGGERDLYAWGADGAVRGLGGSSSGREVAFAGTGGLHADIALSMALRRLQS